MLVEKNRSAYKRELAKIRYYLLLRWRRIQKFHYVGYTLRPFRWLTETWIGELLNIYTWKEVWIAFALPVWIFLIPALWLSLLLALPNPLNALLFWLSFIGFIIAATWGDPQKKR